MPNREIPNKNKILRLLATCILASLLFLPTVTSADISTNARLCGRMFGSGRTGYWQACHEGWCWNWMGFPLADAKSCTTFGPKNAAVCEVAKKCPDLTR